MKKIYRGMKEKEKICKKKTKNHFRECWDWVFHCTLDRQKLYFLSFSSTDLSCLCVCLCVPSCIGACQFPWLTIITFPSPSLSFSIGFSFTLSLFLCNCVSLHINQMLIAIHLFVPGIVIPTHCMERFFFLYYFFLFLLPPLALNARVYLPGSYQGGDEKFEGKEKDRSLTLHFFLSYF